MTLPVYIYGMRFACPPLLRHLHDHPAAVVGAGDPDGPLHRPLGGGHRARPRKAEACCIGRPAYILVRGNQA
jgi:hypothetical protein